MRHIKVKAVGGRAFGHFDREWAEIGLRTTTKRVAMAALKARYGPLAARAAIRLAEKLSNEERHPRG